MTSDASQFVGTIPDNYDRALGPHFFDRYGADLARRVAALKPASVLELAAGTGIVSRKLRDALPADCRLVASDLNPPMLEVARSKFTADEAVSFEEIDATDLAYGDQSFDAVACQFGVMFFPDKHKSYSEVCRVLKPGGHYVFNVWDSLDVNPVAQLAHQLVERFFPDDPPGFYKVPFGYNDPAELERAAKAAGFAAVAVETVPLTVPIQSAALLARGLVFGNPLHEEITSRGGNPDDIRTAAEAAITEQLGSELPLQALVIQATKG